jgi:hypothetical protein
MDRADRRALVVLAGAGLACAGALAVLACGAPEQRPAAPEPGSEVPAAPPGAVPPAAPPPGGAAPPAGAATPGGAAPEAGLPAWSGTLPADFPQDVPLFPGAKVARASGTVDLGLVVSFETGESVETVTSFYVDGFAAQGWSTNLHESPEGRAVFANKEGRTAAAVVTEGDQGTRVEVVVGKLE